MNRSDFEFRVRQALNDAVERLDYRTTFRLEKARQAALARQRRHSPATVRLPALQFASAGAGPGRPVSGRLAWMRRAGLVMPVLAIVLGLALIAKWQDDAEVENLAALDFAVLMDEAPLDTYADRSFGVLLQRELQSRPR